MDLKCFPWDWGHTQWSTIIGQCPTSIALYDERAVGFVTTQQRDEDTWVIGKLGVKKAYRNRGVGQHLLNAALGMMMEHGTLRAIFVVPESFVLDDENNIAAWLTRQGFKAGKVLRDHYTLYGAKEDGIVWQKLL